MNGYVELHCHSCYSLREGASTPAELLHRAADLGYDTLALTDHDGLYGAMEFSKAAQAQGIQPLIGFPHEWSAGTKGTVTAEVVRAAIASEADFAKYHVVLFGDPGSNKWIAKLNGKLPVKWTRDMV